MSSKHKGLSLLEILLVISIVSIMLSVSIPSFGLKNQKLKLKAQEIKSFIEEASSRSFYKSEKNKIQLVENSLFLIDKENGNIIKSYILDNDYSIINETANEFHISPKGTISPFSFEIIDRTYSCKLSTSLFQRVSIYC
jgi:prepilin-type N-terminal cleavage/methylation domain-containing protein